MIPTTHILLLALVQVVLGLLGLLLRRAGMVVLVSALVMLNGILMAFSTKTGSELVGEQPAAVVILVILVAVGVGGGAVLYAFHRFRKTVYVDEHDQMKH